MTISDFYLYPNIRGRLLSAMNYFKEKVNDGMGVFLRASIENGLGEIPICMLNDVENKVSEGEYVTPLVYNHCTRIRRTQVSPMLKDFTIKRSNYYPIVKVDTNNNETYYGGDGMIFDKDFNPLYIECVKLELDTCPVSERIKGAKLKYIETIYHISPNVFTSSGILHRTIGKNFVPAIATEASKNSIPVRFTNFVNADCMSSANVSIMIDNNINDFIIKPSAPMNTDINNELNKLLKENVESYK